MRHTCIEGKKTDSPFPPIRQKPESEMRWKDNDREIVRNFGSWAKACCGWQQYRMAVFFQSEREAFDSMDAFFLDRVMIGSS
jgi:hypothetical protein